MQHQERQRVPIGRRQLAHGLHYGGGGVVGLAHPRRLHEVSPQRVGDERLAQGAQEVFDAAAEHVDVFVGELGGAATTEETLLRKNFNILITRYSLRGRQR